MVGQPYFIHSSEVAHLWQEYKRLKAKGKKEQREKDERGTY
jgi:hypothetical protein